MKIEISMDKTRFGWSVNGAIDRGHPEFVEEFEFFGTSLAHVFKNIALKLEQHAAKTIEDCSRSG